MENGVSTAEFINRTGSYGFYLKEHYQLINNEAN